MKRILIVIVAALLLAAGIAGGLFVFMPGMLGLAAPEAPEAPAPPPEPVAPEPVKLTLVHMTALDVPVVLDGVVNRQVHFTVTLVVKPEFLAAVQEGLPRLRNAFIQLAYAAFPKQYATGEGMDLPRLKASLMQITHHILGTDAVIDVLLQSYIEM